MNYAEIKNCDIANGPGVRVVLFVSGCRHHCPDCFNEVAWNFGYGKPFTQETIDEILALLAPDYIEGLTLLGGEPFEPENQGPVLELVRQVRARYPGKNIWAFSGFTLDQLASGKIGSWPVTKELLSSLDVLVDGPFRREEKDLNLRFRGSRNQRIIDMKKSAEAGQIVLWRDWQTKERD